MSAGFSPSNRFSNNHPADRMTLQHPSAISRNVMFFFLAFNKLRSAFPRQPRRPLKNANFCSSSRTIPQDSGIGQPSGCPQGRGAWTPRVNAKILTTPMGNPSGQASIHLVFRGLKFEPDPRGIGFAFHRAGTEIGQKGAFCKGLRPSAKQLV